MQNLSPKTLFTGQQLIYLAECGSTNTFAQELIIKNNATEGCVVLAGAQTQGKGQRGNTWESEPFQNLTFSLILTPSFLKARDQFLLNMAVSLAVLDAVTSFLPTGCTVKWPNDIYFNNRKLGGILIENSISGEFLQRSIIGIGLNINQEHFTVDTAVSFTQLTGRKYDLNLVLENLLEQLEKRYLQLRQQKTERIKFEYLQNLYKYQEKHFYLIDGKRQEAQIIGVDESGRLVVEVANELRYFGFKEIVFLPS